MYIHYVSTVEWISMTFHPSGTSTGETNFQGTKPNCRASGFPAMSSKRKLRILTSLLFLITKTFGYWLRGFFLYITFQTGKVKKWCRICNTGRSPLESEHYHSTITYNYMQIRQTIGGTIYVRSVSICGYSHTWHKQWPQLKALGHTENDPEQVADVVAVTLECKGMFLFHNRTEHYPWLEICM